MFNCGLILSNIIGLNNYLIVSLFKGIRDITHTDRAQKEGLDDSLRFTIQHSKPGDSGTYCILARNQHGTDRAFVTITVKSPKKKPEEGEGEGGEE